MTDEITFSPADLVCTGCVTLSDGSKGVGYKLVEEEGLGVSVFFDRKQRGQIGTVYQVQRGSDGLTFLLRDRIALRQWADPPQVLEWRTASDGLEATERVKAKSKGVETAAFDKSLRSLDPIRRAYHKTDRLGRLAILAAAMEYIQRPISE